MQGQNEYIQTKTINFPNMVVRVFNPVLTDEERTKRMIQIHKAAANLLMKK